MLREVVSAAGLICWQLRATAVRMRAGNANIALVSRFGRNPSQAIADAARRRTAT
jgi:hypothetical protein